MKYWFLCALLGLAGAASAVAGPIYISSTAAAPEYLTQADLEDLAAIPPVVTLAALPGSTCEGACLGMQVSFTFVPDDLSGPCPPEVCGLKPPPVDSGPGIPEPAAVSLIALGLAVLLGLRIRKRAAP